MWKLLIQEISLRHALERFFSIRGIIVSLETWRKFALSLKLITCNNSANRYNLHSVWCPILIGKDSYDFFSFLLSFYMKHSRQWFNTFSYTSKFVKITPRHVVCSTLLSVIGKVIRRDLSCLIYYFKGKSWSREHTLNTICIIIWSPAFPGYLPAMLAAVKSNMLAPVSVQIQCTNIFFPTPRGPAIRTDFTKGAFSCTAWDPEKNHNNRLITVWTDTLMLMKVSC